MSTFVLVHGAWHRGRHWQSLAEELGSRGHRAVAVDLLGHGERVTLPPGYGTDADWFAQPSPLATLSLEEIVDDLAGQIRALGTPVVVVAHSMGGVVATRLAQTSPDVVERLVYVTAFVPTTTGPAMAYLGTPEASTALGENLYLGDPATTGAVRIDPTNSDAAYRAELAEAYFTGLSDRTASGLVAGLTPDLPACLITTDVEATAGRWGTVSRRYVRTTLDRALPIELQDRMIAEADAVAPASRFDVVTIEAGHAVFASHPIELADALAN